VNDIAVIFQTEFLRRVRSRPYLIGTLFGALGLVLIAVLPSFMMNSFGQSSKRIVLAGPPALVARAKTLLQKDYDIAGTTAEPPVHPSLADLDAYGRAAALVEIVAGSDGLHVTVYARDAGVDHAALADDLVPLNVALSTKLPEARIDKLLVVPVDTESLDAKFTSGAGAEEAKGIALAMVTILYLAIILNAQNIMSSVAEEKTSRIAELLVATVSPVTLLAGKILATAASGVLQIIVWIGVAYAAVPLLVSQIDVSASPGAPGGATGAVFTALNTLGPPAVAAFAVFFLVGFVQFALLYASAASLISRTEDIGSVVAPLVVPVIAGFLFAQFAVGAPNANGVVALSLVPLISPFVMFARIAVATIPVWQVALSLLINLAAIAVIALLAGKIYRVGLLTYGRPPKLAQVWAVLRS
jgi:ABC-2 type transport system permease protein